MQSSLEVRPLQPGASTAQLRNNPFNNQNMTPCTSHYIEAQHAALNSISLPALEKSIMTLRSVWREERQVFAIGNGGSASNASHFATDLGKGASDKLGKRFSSALTHGQCVVDHCLGQ
jgi:hypothetical protein